MAGENEKENIKDTKDTNDTWRAENTAEAGDTVNPEKAGGAGNPGKASDAGNPGETGDAGNAGNAGNAKDLNLNMKSRYASASPSSTVYDKMIKLLDEMDENKFREKVSQAMVEVDRKKALRKRNWIMIAGLLLSMVGTIVIWIDSQAVIKELTVAINLIIEPAGVWKDVFVEPDQIDEFHQRMENASSLDKKGFGLLILGFVVQVVGVVVKGREDAYETFNSTLL